MENAKIQNDCETDNISIKFIRNWKTVSYILRKLQTIDRCNE